VDISGRSTEMIVGKESRTLEAESFKVGSVSLSMKYFSENLYTEKGFKNAQGKEKENLLARLPRKLGTGIEALASKWRLKLRLPPITLGKNHCLKRSTKP